MEPRPIKFRAWDGKAMEYDVVAGRFGAFYVSPGAHNNGIDPNDSASINPCNTLYSPQTPVMQFTGLLDKDGREIYEGDLLDTGYEHHKISDVFFRNGSFSTYIDTGLWLELSQNSFLDEMKIVGNVHENPELLDVPHR